MRRVIRKRIRHTQDGVDLAVDVNADISVNVGPPGQTSATGAGVADDAQVEDPDGPQENDHEGKST